MKSLREKNRYFYEIFKKSLFITLIFLILLFYFIPRFPGITSQKDELSFEIYVSDIPQTSQKNIRSSPPPARPVGMIPVPSEQADFPEEISLSKIPGEGQTNAAPVGIPPEVPPKPLLEVYPSVSGVTCKGYIRLLLLVDKMGRTASIEVLENSTGQDTCLTLVKEAVRKSRWIPASVEDKPVDSWVVKTYTFDTER
ncbi:MAG: hypothetical protein EH225_10200 [Calditrichaeota bacterium]|nr:hypothetical protein [Calditrichota bacterium]RQW00737.1 MAG: hypothetical protein EH225_10200 [Calditrichota bacterium]